MLGRTHCLLKHLDKRAGAALLDAPQALLFQGGEPALLVAYRLTPKADDYHGKHIGIESEAGKYQLGKIGICLDIGVAGVDNDIDRALYLGSHHAGSLTGTPTGRKNQNMIADSTSSF